MGNGDGGPVGQIEAEGVKGGRSSAAVHVPAYSDRGTDAALAETVSDAVRLPDIGLMADLSRSWRLGGAPCWMETPYYNNASMLRILGSDGYFYMHDAADAWGVRPVIVVEEAALAAS